MIHDCELKVLFKWKWKGPRRPVAPREAIQFDLKFPRVCSTAYENINNLYIATWVYIYRVQMT